MNKIILSVLALLSVLGASAQTDGSTSSTGFGIPSGSSKTDVSQTFYIGPGEYQIDGTWQIYSEYVSVSGLAHIYGAGSIEFHNPVSSGGPTYVDGNNAQIDVNVSMGNTQGLGLADIQSSPFTTGDSLNNATFRISRQLSLDSGYFYLNGTVNAESNTVLNGAGIANDLVIDSVGSSGSIAAYDGSHYVVTSNSARGHLVARFITPGAFTFPVGQSDASDYTPAIITPAAAKNLYVSVTNYAGSSATINAPQKGMNRAWNIYSSDAVNADVTLQHNTVTDGTDYYDPLAFITQYLGNGTWSSTKTPEFVSPGVLTANGLSLVAGGSVIGSWFSKTSDFDHPLPITLLSFEAYKQGGTALLEWATASEINNKGFEIQRSSDAKNWSSIGFVNSLATNGNSSSKLSYSFTDNTPETGINYYRLKQTDYYGAAAYSQIRSLDFGVNASIYPNPASSQLNVVVTADSRYQMIDIIGRTLLTGDLHTGKNTVTVSSLPAGNYILRIISNNSAGNYKIIIRR